MAFPLAAVAGAASAGSSILGGIFGASSAKKQETEARRSANLARIQTYNAQIADWQYQTNSQQMAYDFAVAQANQQFNINRATALQEYNFLKASQEQNWVIQKTNSTLDWMYRTASQELDWQFQQTLQDQQYRAQMRAYEQSEKSFAEQTQLINMAARQAYFAEEVKLQAVRDDLMLQGIGLMQDLQLQKRQTELGIADVNNRLGAAKDDFKSGIEASQLNLEQARRETAVVGTDIGKQAQREAGTVAASGRSGASIVRLQQDAYQQASEDFGVLGLNLAFAGANSRAEIGGLQRGMNFAEQDAALNRELLRENYFYAVDDTQLNLRILQRNEQFAIDDAGINIRNSYLQALNAFNQAESSRLLRPLDKINIPRPVPIPQAFIPKPLNPPKPLAATNALKPILPGAPLAIPRPQIGAQVPSSGSSSAGMIIQGILGGVTSGINTYQTLKAPDAGNIPTIGS